MQSWTRLGSLRSLFFRGSRSRPPGEPPKLAIVTCIRNEGEDLVEWLCFHRHIGVSEFVIYDNLSTDATGRILASVPFRKDITVIPVRGSSPQKQAFRDAVRRFRGILDWAAFIDGDEYIVPLADVSLRAKLAEWEAAGVDAAGVHWRIFGSSGHETRPDGLLTENFTRRAPDAGFLNRHVKTLARMSKISGMVTPHYFAMRGRYRLDDGTEPPRNFEGVGSAASFHQGLAIHHYLTKSRAQCMKKIARGRALWGESGQKFRDAGYWDAYDRNEVADDRAAHVIAPIREFVLKLRDEIGRD